MSTRYVYIAQLCVEGPTLESPDVTVELVTTDKDVRDQMLAVLPAARLTYRLVTEGVESELALVQSLQARIVEVAPHEEDDTCGCPDCQTKRTVATLMQALETASTRTH
jgi:hypothetical protein